MESILIVYKSKTGFTKKYVEWIAETIPCKIVPFDQMKNVDMSNYSIIIYGAGMHAGRIQGLNVFRKKAFDADGKNIIVFATGGAPCDDVIIADIKSNNFLEEELKHIKVFYFQSGINYEKMGLVDKTIMKTYRKILELKNDKSDIEDETSKVITKSYNYSNREHIKPMIKYIKQLLHTP